MKSSMTVTLPSAAQLVIPAGSASRREQSEAVLFSPLRSSGSS